MQLDEAVVIRTSACRLAIHVDGDTGRCLSECSSDERSRLSWLTTR
jgi:hypothetical protein